MIYVLSGGGGLNFKVVQYRTAPAETDTAAENTIAVVTDTPVSDWIMSAEQPAGADGLVWIEVAAESDVAFFADKKQRVKLYPKSVKQYVGGAWSNKEAYVYQSSSWVHFSSVEILLYSNGDECTAVTGGWESAYASGDYYNVKGTFTKNENSITINASGDRYVIFAKTANKIDVSDFKTLSVMTSAAKGFGFGLHDGTNWNVLSGFVSYASTSEAGTDSLDIAGITGEYYIALRVAAGNSGTCTEVKLLPESPFVRLYYYNNGVSVIDWTIDASARIAFGETSIVNSGIGADGTYMFFHSTERVDVTNLTSVNFLCDHAMNSGSGLASGYRYFGLSSTGGTSAEVQVNLNPTTSENGTRIYSLDVSNLEGEYYIIYAYYKPGGGYNLGTVTIYEIYGVQ